MQMRSEWQAYPACNDWLQSFCQSVKEFSCQDIPKRLRWLYPTGHTSQHLSITKRFKRDIVLPCQHDLLPGLASPEMCMAPQLMLLFEAWESVVHAFAWKIACAWELMTTGGVWPIWAIKAAPKSRTYCRRPICGLAQSSCSFAMALQATYMLEDLLRLFLNQRVPDCNAWKAQLYKVMGKFMIGCKAQTVWLGPGKDSCHHLCWTPQQRTWTSLSNTFLAAPDRIYI